MRHLAAVILVLALTAGLYLPCLSYDLVLDDLDLVQHDLTLRTLGKLGWFFRPTFWRESRPTRSYRPIVEVSVAINGAFVRGLDPKVQIAALRACNVALLGAAGALVYALAWRLTGSLAAALAAGLVYALHPTHLETVTLIKNRAELLAGVFGLAALAWFLRAARGGGRWWAWWLGSVAATAAALGSKEVALALPLVFCAAAVLLAPAGPAPSPDLSKRPLAGENRSLSARPSVPAAASRRRRRAVLLTVPAWLLAAGFLVLLFSAMPQKYGAPLRQDRQEWFGFAALELPGRLLVVAKTVGVYLELLVWPFTLCVERAFAIPRAVGEAGVLASLGAMAGVIALTAWCWRRHRAAAFALVWLGAALGPVANIVPVGSRPIAEQRLFAATAPFALLAGFLVARLGGLWFAERGAAAPGCAGRSLPVRRVLATAVLAVWLVGTGATIAGALPAWRTDLSLWARTAAQSPEVRRAQYNYGEVLRQNGRFAESLEYLERAIRLDDLVPFGLANYARSLGALGRGEEARRLFRLALSWDPDDPDVARIHGAFAMELVHQRDVEAAIFEARTAVSLTPENPSHYAELGRTLMAAKRFEAAVEAFQRARDLDPGHPGHRIFLAQALEALGRFEEAVAECQAVIDRWAGYPPAQDAAAFAEYLRRRMSGG